MSTTRIASFDDVKVGDEIIISKATYKPHMVLVAETVTKVLKTRINTTNYKFNKRTGDEIGSDDYRRTFIKEHSRWNTAGHIGLWNRQDMDEYNADIQAQQKEAKLALKLASLSSHDFAKLGVKKMQALLAIIEATDEPVIEEDITMELDIPEPVPTKVVHFTEPADADVGQYTLPEITPEPAQIDETIIKLSAKAYEVFVAICDEIQSCTGGQFGFFADVKFPKELGKFQIAGFMSTIINKGLVYRDDESDVQEAAGMLTLSDVGARYAALNGDTRDYEELGY